MQRSIQHLIEDLEEAANNPPASPFIEPPPHLDDNPIAAELALVPFKPISEWTGIDENIFPEMYLLSADDMTRINKAILNLLESIGVEIVDIPDNFPPELLYDVLRSNWDEPVQYLPSSGYDLELCTGDPETCPYGESCSCSTFDDLFDEEEPPGVNPTNYEETELPF
ncbi:MAG: hypothetical protein NTX61_16630 [Bacteroidetes bacterium]|nr:hypothetical protein [Bacteroidota bacterium]